MIKLPSRQVHLDFHTSEAIPGVASKFDKKQFQQALKLGHLNSITVFAKCHHSWSYYPTKVGLMHPTLRRKNLLGEQIDACHEIGVRAPIYYTIGWSANDAARHPEWTVRNKDGSVNTHCVDFSAKPTDRRPTCSWITLCPSGEYLKLILDQTAEICEMFPTDGLFYDIAAGPVCYCKTCRDAMKAQGLDPASDADAAAYNVLKWQHLQCECMRIMQAAHPEATIFFNGAANVNKPEYYIGNTHFELEDLPSVWGGYDHFPLRARFFANSGQSYLAMSGKFHTMWGEFGGFKHRDAIRYEAAAMIAYGARCSFGDQLHPDGLMDLATYRNIGNGYRYVEQIEEFGLDGRPAANLGVYLSKGNGLDDQGVVNMLLEGKRDFQVVDPEGDWSGLATIILTGDVRLDKASAARLKDFVTSGGSLLALGRSGLDAAGKRFLLDMGVRFLGEPNFELDYLQALPPLAADVVDSPFLCYSAALRVKPLAGAEVLSTICEPYFDRTYARYCSHQNTPYKRKPASHVGAVRSGNVVYLAHQLGAMYARRGARLHRQYFLNALDLIHRRPNFVVEMPSAGRATFIHQPEHSRYVAHLLYGPALKRGDCLVIDDLPPLRNVPITIRTSQKIAHAKLVPSGQKLKLTRTRGAWQVTVPEFSCHQAVVFEYK